MTIWIVSEGSPGHVSQSKGLAEAIASLIPTRIEQVEVRQKGTGGLRQLFRGLFRFAPFFRPFWARLCASWAVLPEKSPDLLITSGGKGVFFSRMLADRYRVPLVYCGNPAPYPAGWFDCILATELPDTGNGKWIHTDVLVNPVTPEIVQAAAAASPIGNRPAPPVQGRIGTVLIGGRSRSQRYENSDWLALAGQLNLLAERDGWRWLIATSRRTGQEVESLLEENLNPDYLLDAVWWSSEPRKVVRAYLGYADAVWVGRDSMTMVSEALCSGRPVIVFGPEVTKSPNMIEGFLANLVEKRLILSRPCRDLILDSELSTSLAPLTESPVRSYARKVLEVLKITESA